jgi:hypothetical protein
VKKREEREEEKRKEKEKKLEREENGTEVKKGAAKSGEKSNKMK